MLKTKSGFATFFFFLLIQVSFFIDLNKIGISQCILVDNIYIFMEGVLKSVEIILHQNK